MSTNKIIKMDGGLVGVDRIKKITFGASFSLHLYDDSTCDAESPFVTIYGCRLALSKSNEYFISYPSYKGADGKYYNNAYARLTDEEKAFVIDTVRTSIRTGENNNGGRR